MKEACNELHRKVDPNSQHSSSIMYRLLLFTGYSAVTSATNREVGAYHKGTKLSRTMTQTSVKWHNIYNSSPPLLNA
jgi:hypothetical protein